MSIQLKLIYALGAAMLAALAVGLVGLQGLRAINTDLKTVLAEQMQPLVDLGTVRALLRHGEVDRDTKAVPELLEQVNANKARITELINTYTVKPPGASKGWQHSVSKTRYPS